MTYKRGIKMDIYIDNTLRAMSMALDLAESSISSSHTIIEKISNINYSKHKFLHHAKRTAYIALQLASELKISKKSQEILYAASLLHDIGMSSTMEDIHGSACMIKQHSVKGAEILRGFTLYDISDIILYHHENWNGSGAMGISGNSIPLISQIIRAADLIELTYDDSIVSYKQKDSIICWFNKNTDIIFSPLIVHAFNNAVKKDIFWFDLENVYYMDIILDKISPVTGKTLNLCEFQSIAETFSKIVDTKSTFTAKHSINIAKLAYNVSKYLGYPEQKCTKMKIAGLLHDIGKLAIPSYILEKEGPLSKEEFSIIKYHVYYTKIILNMIGGIDDISYWASNHHEKLDGSGYPCGLTGNKLTEEARIMCVCDIYTALTEDRPYRKGMTPKHAFSVLDDMVSHGSICSKAVSYLKFTIQNENK